MGTAGLPACVWGQDVGGQAGRSWAGRRVCVSGGAAPPDTHLMPPRPAPMPQGCCSCSTAAALLDAAAAAEHYLMLLLMMMMMLLLLLLLLL